MLEIIFFTEANEIERCNVPENVYEKLAQTGFYDLSESSLEHLIIEDDEDYYEVFKLDEDNRKKYIDFLEAERHLELKEIFGMNKEFYLNKDITECLCYIKMLTVLIELFYDKNNVYMWLE